MTRESKLDVIELIRANWNNPNTSINTGGKGVFPDWPRTDLKFNSYPRISVFQVDKNGEWIGVGSQTKKITVTHEIGFWVKPATKKEELIKIGVVVFDDEKLMDHIKNQITELLQDKWQELGSAYLDYQLLSEGEILLDIDRNVLFMPIRIRLVYLEQIVEE